MESEIAKQRIDDQKWISAFKRLLSYKEQFGHVNVKFAFNDGQKPHLGKWVGFQRSLYRSGSLLAHRVNKLKAVGFSFQLTKSEIAKLGTDDQKWNSTFKRLLSHKEQFGHVNVTKHFNDGQQPHLGHWVQAQRVLHRIFVRTGGRARTGSMSKERIVMLNSAGFVWDADMQPEYDEMWMDNFEALKSFQNKYNTTQLYYHHCEYNNTLVTQNSQLAEWVTKQKELYHQEKLDKLRIELLEELNFDWKLDAKHSWEEYYNDLCEYHTKYNTTLLNNKINRNLAVWSQKQRKLYEKDLLEKDRVTKLNLLHFDWNPIDGHWNAMLARAYAYKNVHGNLIVPVPYSEDLNLGYWLKFQRQVYFQHLEGYSLMDDKVIKKVSKQVCTKRVPAEIHEARLAQLNLIGFVWNVRELQWQEMFQRLIQYKNINGDTMVLRYYKEDPKLGKWVENQRYLKRKNMLGFDKIKQLEEVGFLFEPGEARSIEA
ncbi:MAG: hypothetical protein SGILL_006937 [Bacillariaceae sp.]